MIRTTLLFATLLFSSVASADDWANWLGPNRDGTSNEKGLLREWPAGGPKVLWRVPIEQGWSCPSISGGEVFLTGVIRKGVTWGPADEVVRCLDAKTGQEKWKYSYHVENYNTGWSTGGPRSTPTVTDKRVYAIGMMGHVYCFDRKTGAVVWKTSVTEDIYADAIKGDHKGFNQSPVLIDGVIGLFVSQWDVRQLKKDETRDTIIVGLDAATGKVKWTFKEPLRPKTLGCDVPSAQVAEFAGEKCFLWVANRSMLALRCSDGKEVWRFDHCGSDVRGTGLTTLLVDGNRIVDAMCDFGNPIMVEVDRTKAPFEAHVRWTKRDFPHLCTYHNFVPLNGNGYGFGGAYSPNAVDVGDMKLTCIDLATGKTLWQQGGFKHGVSLTEGDGLLFVRSYETLTLVEATPEGYKEKGKMENLHQVPNKGGPAASRGFTDWVMPVLSNGCLYVRTPGELLCLKVSAK